MRYDTMTTRRGIKSLPLISVPVLPEVLGQMIDCTDNGRILLANSNQWYFNNLVKKPCHKTHCRCPHRLNLSFQSSRSCALPNIKVLKDKDLEFANSIVSCTPTTSGGSQAA